MRWGAITVVMLAACGRGKATLVDGATVTPDAAAFVPGAAMVLSANSPGNDEDPAVLVAQDGTIYVAWFSHSAGDDIVISHTSDGAHWTAPAHVSRASTLDYGPTLLQTSDGTIHAAWFRWNGAPPGRIVYAHSGDGAITWIGETDVTTGGTTDDWVPSLAADRDGNLVVAFARNTCPPPNTCYAIASSTRTNNTWQPATTIFAATMSTQHHLPALANLGHELALAWDPWLTTSPSPWDSVDSGARISVTRSMNGVTWNPPVDVTTTQSGAVNLYPTLYQDHAAVWHLAWLTANAQGQHTVEVPLDMPAAAPVMLPIDGYSPRIVATPTPGVFLAAWVGGQPNERDIYVRVFAM